MLSIKFSMWGMDLQISKHEDTILDNATIKRLMGSKCDAVLGQLTEVLPNSSLGKYNERLCLSMLDAFSHSRGPSFLILLGEGSLIMLLTGLDVRPP